MTRSERKLLITTSVLGTLLTVLVASLDAAGFLDQFEEYSYDLRAQRCQFFQPPPTDRLVHIDIDDASLEAIGAWPWPRTLMAEIVDEIRIADTKALAFDVIYSEPQDLRYEPVSQFAPGAATRPARDDDKVVLTRPVNDDEVFAEALRRFGRAIVPVSLNLAQQRTPPAGYRQMVDELARNPELGREQLAVRIGGTDPSLETVSRVQAEFAAARKEALYDRISKAFGEHPDAADLRRYILPSSKEGMRGDIERAFEEQFRRFRAVQALRRFGRTIPGDLPPLVSTRDEQATVESLGRAAKSTGFVDYIPLGDGTVRCVPLWANHRDFMFPQMGLSLACAVLGTEIRDIQVEHDRVIIPKIDGSKIEIPVYERRLRQGRFGMFMDIPWFGDHGSDAWLTMYDYKNYKLPKQHMPIVYIHDAISMRQRIRANNERLRDALIFLWSQIEEPRAEKLVAEPWDPENPEAFVQLAEQTLARLKKDGTVEFWKEMKPEDLDAKERVIREKMLAIPVSIRELAAQAGPLKSNLQRRRDDLHKQLGGKAALIGWIAVGAIADYVPTSMHPRCPGVVVHGVIFNSIMTNHFWYRAPYWITFLLILLMGGAATALVVKLSASQSVVACTVLGVSYIVFNGVYLFDYKNLIVGLAGPVVCSLAVWAGCTTARYIQ
ncbi:MAG: CHASE2 domain-containing protein, partial [Tepidisphaeraceae bacterium]